MEFATEFTHILNTKLMHTYTQHSLQTELKIVCLIINNFQKIEWFKINDKRDLLSNNYTFVSCGCDGL